MDRGLRVFWDAPLTTLSVTKYTVFATVNFGSSYTIAVEFGGSNRYGEISSLLMYNGLGITVQVEALLSNGLGYKSAESIGFPEGCLFSCLGVVLVTVTFACDVGFLFTLFWL